MRFHPDYGKKKASVTEVFGVATGLPAPPDAGRGGSDGPGTYRRIADGNYDIVFKGVGGGRGKGTPTQSTVVEAIEDVPPTPGTSTVVPAIGFISMGSSTRVRSRPRYTLQCPVHSTVVPAIEDKPATRDESTVVEQDKAGKGVEKGGWMEFNKTGKVVEQDKAGNAAEHKAAVDTDEFIEVWRWPGWAVSGGSTSSSSGWNQGWNSRSDWQSGWNK